MPKKDQILTETQRRNIAISEQNIQDLLDYGCKDPLDPEQEIKNYSLIGVARDSFGRRRCLELLKFEDIDFDRPIGEGVYQFTKEEKYNPPRRQKDESYSEYKKRRDKFEAEGLKKGNLKYTTHKGKKKLVKVYLGFISKETRDFLFGLRLIYKNGYVFRKDPEYGEAYYGSTLDRWIKRLVMKANKNMEVLGLPKSRLIHHNTAKDREIYLHIFRSAAPKNLIKRAKGLPPEKQMLVLQTIQKQLGHANFKYTMDLYGQETDETTAENLSLLWNKK